jgi:hypothetical protein
MATIKRLRNELLSFKENKTFKTYGFSKRESYYSWMTRVNSIKDTGDLRDRAAANDLTCLIWVLPWNCDLDVVSNDEQFDGLTEMEKARRSLIASEVSWAVLTNGKRFRVLNKTSSHKPLCYLELDLDTMIDRRGEPEARLAFRYLQGMISGPSLMERDSHDNSRLDRALIGSERHGKEIGDELKQNVFQALEELGEGFLYYLKTHPNDLETLKQAKNFKGGQEEFLMSEELLQEIYQESLALVYRLLFLFYAESRNLLPMENDTYRESYSLESLRDEVIDTHDDPDPKSFFGQRDTRLWNRLLELTEFVNVGWQKVIPAYNGGFFDSEQHQLSDHSTEIRDLVTMGVVMPQPPLGPRGPGQFGRGQETW